MNIRNILSTLLCLAMTQTLVAQTKQTQVNLDYIEKYSSIAVKKMHEHGIPASITLAQGILESGAGNSVLAKKSNNHFGIKCHNDWNGEKVYHDDDVKDDCFRKYPSVEDSYEDHSQFLKRPRYASLFNLKTTDYKGWAKGLKQCGYATDPNYSNRLINLIETYELQKYDQQEKKEKTKKKEKKEKEKKEKAKKSDKQKKSENKATTDTLQLTEKELTEKELAEKEAEIRANYLLESKMGSIPAYITHPVKYVNGKKAVIARAGDTYEVIAKEFGLRKWEIRWYNHVKKGAKPEEGRSVYLQKKK